MSNYLISVLVLSYNHAGYIEKAIKSIFNQKIYIDSIEIIVVDDGSSDGTVEILEEMKVNSPLPMRVLSKEHRGIKGISKSFNEMIALANGKYIAFLSADDEYYEDRFRNQISLLEENSIVKIIYSNGVNKKNGIQISNVLSKSICRVLEEENAQKLYFYITKNNDPLYMQGLLIDSEFIKKFNPFDPSLISDDWIFNITSLLQLCENGYQFRFLNKHVFARNLLPNATSNISAHHIPRVLGVINKYCQSDSKSKLKMQLYFNMTIIGIKNKNLNSIEFAILGIINGVFFVVNRLYQKLVMQLQKLNN